MTLEKIKKELKNGKVLKISHFCTIPDYIVYKDNKYIHYQTFNLSPCDVHIHSQISVKWKEHSPFEFISKTQFLLETIKLEIEKPEKIDAILHLS